MKFPVGWFRKANPKSRAEPSVDEQTADMQGKYTDYHDSAYSLRQSIAPLHGEELEAFEWVLNKMAEDHPESAHSQAELIERGFDDRWFIYGKQGELRVTQEPPA